MLLNKLHTSGSIEFYTCSTTTQLNLPLSISHIKAGFPSPAEDFSDISIDLNKELIKNPSSTFFGRVTGDSMKDLGVEEGDLLVIDKSIIPTEGKLAICFIDGEFTLKKIHIDANCIWLVPANDNYKPIKVTQENDFMVWGIVTHVIKSF